MTLHEQLQHDLDQHRAADRLDLDHLARAARRDGTTRRRRRTAGLTLLGAAAAAAVLGVVGTSLGGTHPDHGTVAADAPAPPPGPSGPDVAATPRGVVAALAWSVSRQEAGTTSGYQGQGGTKSVVGDLFGHLVWHDADGAGVSVVEINVQGASGMFSSCADRSGWCSDVTQPDGSREVSYDERPTVASGVAIRRVVDLMRPDGMRVVVSSTNGLDLGGNRWEITRREPPLTTAQLQAVAEEAFWGHTLPQSFVDAGEDLAPYVDIDARQAREWTYGAGASATR